MFVLGIDPGLSRCGYGLLNQTKEGVVAVKAGVITTDPSRAIPDRLAELRSELKRLMSEQYLDVVVVERVFFQTNAKTAMFVGQASGVALLSASELHLEIAEYTSNEVKLAVAGYGGASKDQVKKMMMTLLKLEQVPNPPDVADALALAYCHLSASRIPQIAKSHISRGAPGTSSVKPVSGYVQEEKR